MIWKILKILFSMKAKQRLDIVPRHYANEYDRRVSRDVARVMIRTAARSPVNVDMLLKQYKVDTVDELLKLLPSRKRKVNPRERFRRWMMRLESSYDYEPVIRPALRRMHRGDMPQGTLIRKTKCAD